jgi:UDP-3-O-[3-hydroxymyristoyl] glucosamine N-acyltransferase
MPGVDGMARREFFNQTSSMTVGQIASLTGAIPSKGTPLDRIIDDVAPIEMAGPSDVTFFDNLKYLDGLAATQAGVCLISERFEDKAPRGLAVLQTKEPYRAFVTVQRKLFPESLRPISVFGADGIAQGAIVHSSARLESGVTVDPGAVIGPNAKIGSGTVIGATAVIGPGVQIGRDCSIGAGCTITHTVIGDRVVIHPGTRTGQDGFGYIGNPTGIDKVPQIGRVIIQDDVEIGSGTMIDRGGIRDTIIGEGTKIDNLCQIAHNVVIGRHCIIAGQTGISGSVTIEDFVVFGARVGVIEHVTIGKGAHLAARSSVLRSVPPGARWGGLAIAKPIKQYFRELLIVERLGRGADISSHIGASKVDD